MTSGKRFARQFVRIRYFGLLANRHRAQLLALCRSHLVVVFVIRDGDHYAVNDVLYSKETEEVGL
jgi:hypothetical protein